MKSVDLHSTLHISLVILITTIFSKVNPALSQNSNIIPDETLGEENSVVNVRDETSDQIDGGATRGSNLFHSFQEFNVGEERGVYFSNPDGINNIFSRVTGSNASNILGTLGVDGAANLYLINPNGIIFGANSSLDVNGSFTATTAHGVRFGEQGTFDAINPETPQLLTINPSAYFFNQLENRNTSTIQSQGTLEVPEGKNLTLLGGDIELTGSRLFARGGLMELGSVQGTGEIEINELGNLTFPENVTRGDISLSNESWVNVRSGGGGFITVQARNLELLENSQIIAGIRTGLGSQDAIVGDIRIEATNKIHLDNSKIANNISKEARGNIEGISISTGSLTLINGGRISSLLLGKGNIEGISISTGSLTLINGGRISSRLLGEGNSDGVFIDTGSLTLINGGGIVAGNFGKGNAGSIEITAIDSITIDGKGGNENSSGLFRNINLKGQGDGDREGQGIIINTSSLTIKNHGIINSRIKGQGGQGKGGNITVNANSLKLENNGVIGNPSKSNLSAGNITLNVANSFKQVNSFISSQSKLSTGGDITIIAKTIELRGDSFIRTDVDEGDGGGGNISLEADSIIAFDDSDIFTFAEDGQGGKITLKTPAFFGENFTLNSLKSNPDNLSGNNRVDINATGRVSGFVSIPDVSFIQNSLTELFNNAINTDKLVANSCVVPNRQQKGTFIITGKGGLATTPDDELITPYSTGEVQTIESDNNSNWQPGDPIVEPQGVYRLSNGKLILSRECSRS